MSVVRLVFLLLFSHLSLAQVGQFPQPLQISLDKPVFATSTCGEVAETFCGYSSNASASLSPNCMSAVCNAACNFGSSSPSSIDLTNTGTKGSGVSTPIGVSGPGTSDVLEFTNSFVSIPSTSVAQVTSNGFTFAVWMKQDDNNNGALISKASSDGANRTYAVSVTETTVTFDYLPNTVESGFSTLTFGNLDLRSDYWHHIAVTLYDNDFALYVNGSVEEGAGLTAPIDDSLNTVYLGQVAPGLNQYNGLMQDIFTYSQALTAREIEELVTQDFPYNSLQSECRCPPSHPVINSVSPSLCIQHSGTTSNRGSETRLNSLAHPAGFITDKSFLTAWISDIDLQQSNVSMTLTSGSDSAFELIFVNIRYAAPPPKAAVLEKTIDDGITYQPLQYFASDCSSYFGMQNDGSLQTNDDVNCITEYSSQSPASGVTARIRFADGSRGALISTNEVLQNFILSDGIRLRLIDYFTEDTTAQHRYYSIGDITVAARCSCNGHSPRCSSDIRAICDCVHNTQGDRCDECLPLYNDKPWRKGTESEAFECKECDCNGHSLSCTYNATIDPYPDSYEDGGGGVCEDCQDNTAGTHCDTCVFGYYRMSGVNPNDTEPCSPCSCDNIGSTGEDCVKHEGIPGELVGQCECKANVEGLTCDECKNGFFNLSTSNTDGCEPCGCNTDGTVGGSQSCQASSGQCVCKVNVEGLKCDQCVNGTQGLDGNDPDGCSVCFCHEFGSVDGTCDPLTGNCICKLGVSGDSCDQCQEGFYGFSEDGCQQCPQCSAVGSVNSTCRNDGTCYCKTGFTGQTCDQCSVGYFNTSNGCGPCQCDELGTVNDQINNCHTNTGQCQCEDNVMGRDCDTCALNYTNLQDSGCTECDCVLTNTNTTSMTICDSVTSQCDCLPSASGLKCDSCQDGYYSNSEQSCLDCNCNSAGSSGIGCASLTGQCTCINENITGLSCDQCTSGHYDFPNCYFCQCNTTGSINSVCDSNSGVCQCKEFVTGMNCDTCQDGYQMLQASNPFGCSAAPEEQSPPTAQTIAARFIVFRWSPPDKPNGVIALYTIRRNGVLIDSIPGSVRVFNDTGLTPNTVYQYSVEAENIIGSVVSESTSFTTLEGSPEQVNPPSLVVISSTSVRADWTPPNIPNGVIVGYNLILVSVDNVLLDTPLTVFSGLAFSYVVTGLTPFTVNTFRLEACTSQDCGSSDEVNITTEESIPTYQPPPMLTTINASAISLTWAEPPSPNGIIVKYEIYQRVSPFAGNGSLVESVSSNTFSLVVVGLQPFTEYEYSVASFTSVGGRQSNWTREKTQEITPEQLIDPKAIPVSSTELRVEWVEPAKPNGVILSYEIIALYPDNTTRSIVNSTTVGSHVLSDLLPFTRYGFYVIVCNTAGCSTTGTTYNTTFEGVPSALDWESPIFPEITGTSVTLDWDPPSSPNGIITSYSVTRQRPSLESSPARRDIGTVFHGADFASYSPPIIQLSGFMTSISLMFKTLRPDGVLMYSINNAGTDMIAIELRNGIPWFIFDAGTGSAAISLNSTAPRYDDGKWHEIIASRLGVSGSITVDDVYTSLGESEGVNTFIGQPSVLYIGGLANDARLATVQESTNPNATLNGFSFAGCLFGFKFNQHQLNLSSLLNPNPGVGDSSTGCPLNREQGVSFIGGGYISMPYTPPETEPFSLSVHFRTTRSSSLLFFAYNSDRGSYVLVMLQDSHLVVRILSNDDGEPEISLSSSQASLPSGSLCNGQWHNLLVIKEFDGVVVNIDNLSISAPLQTNINITTTSNLFIGGVPVSSSAWDTYYSIFSSYPNDFSGCIRDFEYDGVSMNLHRDFGDSLEHVRFDGCDSSIGDGQSCDQGTNDFDSGVETEFVDNSNISSFTEYLYRVSAENSAGQAFSSWSLGMTGENSPESVGFVSVATRTSSSTTVTWSLEGTTNGLIIRYEITASPQSTVGLDTPIGNNRSYSLDIESPVQELRMELSELEPATNYSVVLIAFTSIGPGTGPAVIVETLEDIPIGVQTPSVSSRGANEVTLQWNSPTQPNGVITVYRVYIDDSFLPTTNTFTTVDSLNPFTTYEYILEACTAIGCSNSTGASVFTVEGPPNGLSPPTLLALSSETVQVSWTTPSEPNGIITHYEVFRVFGADLSQTELVANTSQLSTTVSDLSPNTLYYFRVVAHNSAGSVNSNISSVTTLEDTPEQILPPTITVVNSTSLLVTWQEPLQPNGVITSYTLYRNSASVFSTAASLMYLDTGLEPFFVYTYFVIACNTEGCGSSSMSSARTDEAIAELLQSPVVVSTTSDSAMITILPANKTNGIVTYMLRITGEFLIGYDNNIRQTVSETRVVYNDSVPNEGSSDVLVQELIPFAAYNVQLEVKNSAGSALGEIVSFTTSQAAPEVLLPPQVELVTSTSLRVTWSPPTYPNGEITSYDVIITNLQSSNSVIRTLDANSNSTIIDSLDPFTTHSVHIIAENSAGNVTSNKTNILTGEIAPADFDQPIISSTTSYSIMIAWDPPTSPNGIILNYTVIVTDDGIDDSEVSTVTVPATMIDYNITGLLPFNEYNITVEACNSAGCKTGPSVSGMTDEIAPQGLAAPMLMTLPNAVVISWIEPDEENGIIISYTIYRAILGGNFEQLQTVAVNSEEQQNLAYTDSTVEPYTRYQYTVEASNSAGSVLSPHSTVLTEESAPEGVLEPLLEALNSSSIIVRILFPTKPNGIITSFTVGRFMSDSSNTMFTTIPISNPDQLNVSYIDTGLSPYTVYHYFVTAFTAAGNATGNSSSIRTLEAPPTNLDEPNVASSGDTSILIAWSPPLEENGVITSYSLLRGLNFGSDSLSNSMPECCQSYLESEGSGEFDDSSVCDLLVELDGDITSYDDKGLDSYTYYSYCVIATNGAGSVVSSPSNTLQTPPALQPLAGPNVTTMAINSTAILINWFEPDPSDLLGPLTSYVLYGKEAGEAGLGEELQSGLSTTYTYTELTPSTTYTFVVSVNNSRGVALSTPVHETTSDGIPMDVQNPAVLTMSSTTILVSWAIPLTPNGQIIRYSIFLNGELYLNQSSPGSVLVSGLKPFTDYVFRLEACTALGCAFSGQVVNTTFEGAPSGLASPFVTILDPYSALVSWSSPAKPNGIITHYSVYLVEGDQTTLAFSGYRFNYTVTGLSPDTQYGFEVVAVNGGGNVSSGITTATTDEAPPTLVFPPTVTTLSAYAILVEWETPLEPNGMITNYDIFRDNQLLNTYSKDILEVTDTGLSPFTEYRYAVQACTSAGCTNSSEAINMTHEAQPAGFDDPLVTDIQSDSISLSWGEPSSPNGVINSYSVSFANGTLITSGLNTSTTVQGLSPFTNYSFIVTVCNTEHCLDSNMVAIVTLEIPPTGLDPPSVKYLSSMEVEVNWQPPSQPNGIITMYILRRDGGVVFNGSDLTHDDGGLEGDTSYVYTVEAVNSAGSVISPPLAIQTQADLPSGVLAPDVMVLNSTAIYVEWSEPESDNGQISAYKLFVDNDEVVSGLLFNYTVSDLSPYTNYTFYIQVCNQVGCASSKSVVKTTAEALPIGLANPVFTTISATSVSVSWSPPDMPNGAIVSYRVLRRQTNNPILVLIQYVGGGDTTVFTNQDLNPYTSYEYQVIAFNSIGSVESDWAEVTTLEGPPTGLAPPTFPVVQSTYVLVSWNEPANPNGILTQYEVSYRPLLGQLVLLETLPVSVTELNVTGLEPFTFYEFQITVHNSVGTATSDFSDTQTLEGAPEGLGDLILVTRTSESITLTWNEPSEPNGIISEYVLYLDGVEEYRDVLRTFTIDRLKPFTSYSVLLEACTSAACSQGMLQGFTTEESTPIGQPSPELTLIGTRAVKIEWGFPIQSNGIITSYEIFRSEVPEPLIDNTTEVDSILIYTTLDVSNRVYNDTELTPDMGYLYAVRANNSIGHSLSSYEYIQTPQAPPELVQSPVLEVTGIGSIKLTWDPPGQRNGELTNYQIYRTTSVTDDSDTVEVYSGLNREFTDTGLNPYTQYFYTIEACTIAGCTNSSVSNATTLESAPEDIPPPVLQALSATSVSVKWTQPSTPNGVLVSYIVNVISPVSINSTTESNVLETTVTSLEPYTVYTIVVQACTMAGCVTSNASSIRTLESIPMLQGAPTVLALGPTSVDVSWSQPAKPNGIIVKYTLRRNDTIIQDNEQTSFTDNGLLPNQKYGYDVQSFTSAGGGDRSPVSIVTTDSDTPSGVNKPVLTALDSTSILATWTIPNTTNGVIQKYVLYVNETARYEGVGMGHVVTGLEIFSTYRFRVEACTTTCASSLYSYATTMEGQPLDMLPPILTLLTNDSVLITWSPPATPNGIILTYSIDRVRVTNGEMEAVVSLASDLPATTLEYADNDNSLTPATVYSYRVSGSNSVGSVTSNYTSITLPDGAPQNLSSPVLISKTSSSFTVSVSPPLISNGVLTKYTLFGDNLFPVVVTPTNQDKPVQFTLTDLDPYTMYRVYAEVCTIGGCVLGPATTIQTNEAPPEGLLSPFATTESPRRIRVDWSSPTHPNGIITGYQLFYKLPCPQPQVLPAATNAPLCVESSYKLLVNTTSKQYVFDSSSTLADPHPYSSYQFLLQVENSVGSVNSTDSAVITTDDSVPEQVNDVLFTVYTSNQSIALNWGSSFRVNGQLKSYTVIRDGVFLFIGSQTYAVFPNQPVNTVLRFSVRVSNVNYQFTTSGIPLQITVDEVQPSVTLGTPTDGNTTVAPPESTEFYNEAAFIVGMVLLAVIICFVCVLVCLCLIRPNRERETTSGKYDTLRSEKGSPLREDGTTGSGWTHERVLTPVPSYNDALHNYTSVPVSKGASSYSPVKAELMSQGDSYPMQSKADLTRFNHLTDEVPLLDTHISRLSVIEEIPMNDLPETEKTFEPVVPGAPPSVTTNNETVYSEEDTEVNLKKDLAMTNSQEFIMDTAI